jgi:uncharacterized protein YaeQ
VYLSDFDLQQLDAQKLTALPAEQKDALLVKLLWDLKDARERLKRGKGLNAPDYPQLPTCCNIYIFDDEVKMGWVAEELGVWSWATRGGPDG